MGGLIKVLMQLSLQTNVTAAAAVVAGVVGNHVSQDLPQPGGELRFGRPAETGKISVCRQAGVLDNVGIIQPRPQLPVELEPREQLEVRPIPGYQSLQGRALPRAGPNEELVWL